MKLMDALCSLCLNESLTEKEALVDFLNFNNAF